VLALAEITATSLNDLSVRRTESSICYEIQVSIKAAIPIKMRVYSIYRMIMQIIKLFKIDNNAISVEK